MAGITDVGQVRKHNEDSILIDKELGLFIVADGMGGHHAGEIASQEAIEIVQKMLQLQRHSINKSSWLDHLTQKWIKKEGQHKEKTLYLEKSLREANNHVFQLNLENKMSLGNGMGTTIAGCWFISPDVMLAFHIGDSRVYRFRNRQLVRLTKDHSALQQWQDDGCIGEKPKSNVIVNAIGPFAEAYPAIQSVDIEDSDIFLICSDGLTDMLVDKEIEQVLQGITAEQAESYCRELLKEALQSGGRDNVSLILLVV